MNQYNLAGVDFDWEYPSAPDIPGIPPGSPTDGSNYLSFLQTLCSLLALRQVYYLHGCPGIVLVSQGLPHCKHVGGSGLHCIHRIA